MSPVWLIEGGAAIAESEVPGNGAEHASAQPRFPNTTDQRLSALAAAVRDHESRGRHHAIPARPEDLVLYRRLRQICGER